MRFTLSIVRNPSGPSRDSSCWIDFWFCTLNISNPSRDTDKVAVFVGAAGRLIESSGSVGCGCERVCFDVIASDSSSRRASAEASKGAPSNVISSDTVRALRFISRIRCSRRILVAQAGLGLGVGFADWGLGGSILTTTPTPSPPPPPPHPLTPPPNQTPPPTPQPLSDLPRRIQPVLPSVIKTNSVPIRVAKIGLSPQPRLVDRLGLERDARSFEPLDCHIQIITFEVD